MTTFVRLAALASIFVAVCTCSMYALGNTGFDSIKGVLAPAVAMLCVLSLLRGAGDARGGSLLEVVLIPYAALAYALVFVGLLWLLSQLSLRLRRRLEDRHCRAEDVQRERPSQAIRSNGRRLTRVRSKMRRKGVRD